MCWGICLFFPVALEWEDHEEGSNGNDTFSQLLSGLGMKEAVSALRQSDLWGNVPSNEITRNYEDLTEKSVGKKGVV
jgi:hypothetical protein